MKRFGSATLTVYFVSFLLSAFLVKDALCAPGDFLYKWDHVYRVSADISVDSAGNVYLADTFSNRIRVFDEGGTLLREWGGYGTAPGKFMCPFGIDVDDDGYVYVSDTFNNRIQVFDNEGNFIRMWGSYGTAFGRLNYPYGIAVDGEKRVYVSEYYNHRVQVFTSSGVFIRGWGGYGSHPGKFRGPRGIDVGHDGTVYVADYGNHRVQVFDGFGSFRGSVGMYGSEAGQFQYPYDVAVDEGRNIYVADYRNHRVQVFDDARALVDIWGTYGKGDGALRYPSGIAVYGNAVYVTDIHSGRIQVFEGEGMDILVADAGPDQTVEQSSPEGALVVLDGIGSSQGCGGEVICEWTWPGGHAFGTTPNALLPPGTTTVLLTAFLDSSSATDTVEITVRDTTPPALTCPPDIAILINTLFSDSAVTAFISGAAASDVADPDVLIENNIPKEFGETGIKAVTFTATDDALNQSTCTSHIWVQYGFGGFLPPVSLGKAFTLGRTLPVKFRIYDAYGGRVVTATPTIMLQKFSGGLPVGNPVVPSSRSGADTDNTVRAGGVFIYNLDTTDLSEGTWKVIVLPGDGTTRTIFIYIGK